MAASGRILRDIDVLSNMIVTSKAGHWLRGSNIGGKDGAFGKRKRARALITLIQIPFVMLRFILRKGRWLMARSAGPPRFGPGLASNARIGSFPRASGLLQARPMRARIII